MSDDDELQLAVMLKALDAIADYIQGLDDNEFLASRMTVDAVAMNLLVVGECANRLSEALKGKVPAPWRQIVGLRHHLAHDYFGMSSDRLWRTASLSAPELRRLVLAWMERP